MKWIVILTKLLHNQIILLKIHYSVQPRDLVQSALLQHKISGTFGGKQYGVPLRCDPASWADLTDYKALINTSLITFDSLSLHLLRS